MKHLKILFLTSVLCVGVAFGKPKTEKVPQPFSELDSLSYSMGVYVGNSLKPTGLTKINEALFTEALAGSLKGDPSKISTEDANKFIQQYFQKLMQAKQGENVKKGKEFLAENSKKPGVITLPSGLQYKVLVEGKGEKPAETNKVTVHYHGTTIDGKVFDSSRNRGEPAQFPVNGVIKGWVEALQLMPVGSKWMLYIPSELAYGDRDMPTIPANSVLIFEVELISIDKTAN